MRAGSSILLSTIVFGDVRCDAFKNELADNVEGELFGFERVLELVRSRPSAAQIAEAAQTFGQEDDISVISVTRVPVAAPTMA